mmetsp:Transcript_8762/g.27205  ORF Transcript_8762/g.27205 Transcript_8762/m.27205 type:complete len:209 (-) Transcript_8762:778-1404(-)
MSVVIIWRSRSSSVSSLAFIAFRPCKSSSLAMISACRSCRHSALNTATAPFDSTFAASVSAACAANIDSNLSTSHSRPAARRASASARERSAARRPLRDSSSSSVGPAWDAGLTERLPTGTAITGTALSAPLPRLAALPTRHPRFTCGCLSKQLVVATATLSATLRLSTSHRSVDSSTCTRDESSPSDALDTAPASAANDAHSLRART